MAPEDPFSLLLNTLREHEPSFVLATPEDANFFRSQVQRACQNNLKNLEFTKEAPRDSCLGQTTISNTEGVSEDKNSGVKLTARSPTILHRQDETWAKTDRTPIEHKSEVFAPPPKPMIAVEKTALPKPPIAKAESTSELSALPPRPKLDFSLVRNVLSVVAPELAILNEIPNDEMARKVSQRWKTKNQTAPISVLCYQEPPEQRALLEGIVSALDVCFGPAKLIFAEPIEKEKQWETFLGVAELKMVIVCDYTLWQLHGLMQSYKEIPSQGVRTLGNVPLFLLPDLSLYLKDPLLKRSLWKALCQKFS